MPYTSKIVYPACAGIHLVRLLLQFHCHSLPRMRGDPPPYLSLTKQGVLSTPHARGSTREALRRVREYAVYPACAGIHPPYIELDLTSPGLPRMRGDPPR